VCRSGIETLRLCIEPILVKLGGIEVNADLALKRYLIPVIRQAMGRGGIEGDAILPSRLVGADIIRP
jgi:hypothetical protein